MRACRTRAAAQLPRERSRASDPSPSGAARLACPAMRGLSGVVRAKTDAAISRGRCCLRRLRWLQSGTTVRQITGAGEPSSRSSNYRYFFLAAFFFFAFFFAAMVHLLTSGLIDYKCIQHLLLHSQIIAHDAACDSYLVSKTRLRRLVRQF